MNQIFQNKAPDFERLLAFGFKKSKDIYSFSTLLFDNQFELIVNVDKNGVVSDKMTDLAINEPYTLYKNPSASGEFVGKIKELYEEVLSEICEKCFYPDVFKAKQAKRTIEYIKEKYGDELEFLWDKFKGSAIVRRKDNSKWYAVFITLKKNKLGLIGEEEIEIIDLRINPNEIENLVDNKKYFKGYHMNKKHWFTMCFNDSISDGEMFKRIDESYLLAKKK